MAPTHRHFAKEIIDLKNKDIRFRNQLIQERKLGLGYHPEMEKIHIENAKRLDQIIDEIGYPTRGKVGVEASEAAWLIIQHAISLPSFMNKCMDLLCEKVNKKVVNPLNYAYLSDRIAILGNQPQKYGTQFEWDEEDQLVPCEMDNLKDVNQRRKKLGLNSVEDQKKLLNQQAIEENHQKPKSQDEHQKSYDEWRRRVGWIV